MPKTYAIDFETYYETGLDIKSLGTWHYLQDPRTDIYMVAVAGPEGYAWVGRPEDFDWSILKDQHLIAHNYAFDGTVLKRLQEKKIAPAELEVEDGDCTADMCAYLGMNRALKLAAKVMLDRDLSKDVRDKMKGKHFRDLSETEKKETLAYAQTDAVTCLELWDKYSAAWPEWERQLSRINRQATWKGVHLNGGMVDKCISDLNRAIFNIRASIPWIEDEDSKVLSPKALAEHCRKIGIEAPASTAEDSPELTTWENKYGSTNTFVRDVIKYRKTNRLLKILQTLKQRRRPDGTFQVELKYFGANQTGRMSGTGGMNIQNLPREPFEGVDLRNCFEAGPGNVFICCDLSQIEPRVLNWFAGNTKMLADIREGWSIYEAFARASGLWNGEKGTLKKNKPLYSMVKAQALGCGYGMGPERYMEAAPLLTGGEYRPTLQESVIAVHSFRANNPKVKKFWDRLDNEFKASRGRDYTIELPSGRIINYFRVSGMDWSYEKEKGNPKSRVRTYGAKLVENATQACARDILADMIVKAVIDQGLCYKFSVHDEIIIECPEKDAEACKKKLEQVMTTPPDWMNDIPLACESQVSKFYIK
jgi:DNA polymerase I-like protein with 3'-5' exonuclease and polymerase domains